MIDRGTTFNKCEICGVVFKTIADETMEKCWRCMRVELIASGEMEGY